MAPTSKVTFVDNGEDARVKLVRYDEDIRIKRVDRGEQLKVKIVCNGESQKAKRVDACAPAQSCSEGRSATANKSCPETGERSRIALGVESLAETHPSAAL